MNMEDFRTQADALASDKTDATRMMAGKYAQLCLRSIGAHDWTGARGYLLEAVKREPELLLAAALIDAAENGSKTSEARAAASRSNGRLGGRPRRPRAP